MARKGKLPASKKVAKPKRKKQGNTKHPKKRISVDANGEKKERSLTKMKQWCADRGEKNNIPISDHQSTIIKPISGCLKFPELRSALEHMTRVVSQTDFLVSVLVKFYILHFLRDSSSSPDTSPETDVINLDDSIHMLGTKEFYNQAKQVCTVNFPKNKSYTESYNAQRDKTPRKAKLYKDLMQIRNRYLDVIFDESGESKQYPNGKNMSQSIQQNTSQLASSFQNNLWMTLPDRIEKFFKNNFLRDKYKRKKTFTGVEQRIMKATKKANKKKKTKTARKKRRRQRRKKKNQRKNKGLPVNPPLTKEQQKLKNKFFSKMQNLRGGDGMSTNNNPHKYIFYNSDTDIYNENDCTKTKGTKFNNFVRKCVRLVCFSGNDDELTEEYREIVENCTEYGEDIVQEIKHHRTMLVDVREYSVRTTTNTNNDNDNNNIDYDNVNDHQYQQQVNNDEHEDDNNDEDDDDDDDSNTEVKKMKLAANALKIKVKSILCRDILETTNQQIKDQRGNGIKAILLYYNHLGIYGPCPIRCVMANCIQITQSSAKDIQSVFLNNYYNKHVHKPKDEYKKLKDVRDIFEFPDDGEQNENRLVYSDTVQMNNYQIHFSYRRIRTPNEIIDRQKRKCTNEKFKTFLSNKNNNERDKYSCSYHCRFDPGEDKHGLYNLQSRCYYYNHNLVMKREQHQPDLQFLTPNNSNNNPNNYVPHHHCHMCKNNLPSEDRVTNDLENNTNEEATNSNEVETITVSNENEDVTEDKDDDEDDDEDDGEYKEDEDNSNSKESDDYIHDSDIDDTSISNNNDNKYTEMKNLARDLCDQGIAMLDYILFEDEDYQNAVEKAIESMSHEELNSYLQNISQQKTYDFIGVDPGINFFITARRLYYVNQEKEERLNRCKPNSKKQESYENRYHHYQQNNISSYSLSSKELYHLYNTEQYNHQTLLRATENNSTTLFNLVGGDSGKKKTSWDLDEFRSYIDPILENFEDCYNYAFEYHHRQYRFNRHKKKQAAVDKIVKDLCKERDPKECIILWGNGTFTNSFKGKKTLPLKRLRKDISQRVKALLVVSEFNTSKYSSCCHSKVEHPRFRKKEVPVYNSIIRYQNPLSAMVIRKKMSPNKYKIMNNLSKCTNCNKLPRSRDLSACDNIIWRYFQTVNHRHTGPFTFYPRPPRSNSTETVMNA